LIIFCRRTAPALSIDIRGVGYAKASSRKRSRYPRDWSAEGRKNRRDTEYGTRSDRSASQVTLEKTNKIDHFSLTYADYAYKAGAWRLLDLMEEFKITGSVSTNRLTGERQPKWCARSPTLAVKLSAMVGRRTSLPKVTIRKQSRGDAQGNHSSHRGCRHAPSRMGQPGSAGSTNTLDFLKMEDTCGAATI
jgi:hypothetical protein